MNMARICSHDVVTIDATASLRDAARTMRDRHVGVLVVTALLGEQERVFGMLTDRDLTIEVLSRDVEPTQIKVGQIASRNLAAIPADAGIADAVEAMRQAGVRRLLVTGEHGEVAGLVSSDDLLDALAAELAGLAQALRNGIVREGSERGAIAPRRPRPVFLPHGTPGLQEPVVAP